MTSRMLVEMLREEPRPLHAAAADRLEELEARMAQIHVEAQDMTRLNLFEAVEQILTLSEPVSEPAVIT